METLFDALYSKLVLRDIVSYAIPGATLLTAMVWSGQKELVTVARILGTATPFQLLGLGVLGYIIGHTFNVVAYQVCWCFTGPSSQATETAFAVAAAAAAQWRRSSAVTDPQLLADLFAMRERIVILRLMAAHCAVALALCFAVLTVAHVADYYRSWRKGEKAWWIAGLTTSRELQQNGGGIFLYFHQLGGASLCAAAIWSFYVYHEDLAERQVVLEDRVITAFLPQELRQLRP